MTNVILTVFILARGITPSDRGLRMVDSIWLSSNGRQNKKNSIKISNYKHSILPPRVPRLNESNRWNFDFVFEFFWLKID